MSASPHKFVAGLIPALMLARLAAGQMQPAPSAAADSAVTGDPAVTGGAVVTTTAPVTATVVGDRVNIRAGTDTRYEVLGQLKRGDIVKAKVVQGRWLGIVPPAAVGVWIHQDFVRDDEVVGDRVNLRAGPSTSFTRVGQVVRGEKLAIIESADGWLRIEPPTGVTVWAHLDFLELAPGVLERLPSVAEKEDSPAAAAPGAPVTATPDTARAAAEPAAPTGAATAAPGEPAPEGPEPVVSETVVPAPAEIGFGPATPIRDAQLFPDVPDEPAASSDFIVQQVRPDTQTATPDASDETRGSGRSRLRWPTEEEFRRLGKAVSREGLLQKVTGQDGETVYAIVSAVGVRVSPECFLFSPATDLGQYEGQKVRMQGRELWAGRTRPVVRVERISAAW